MENAISELIELSVAQIKVATRIEEKTVIEVETP